MPGTDVDRCIDVTYTGTVGARAGWPRAILWTALMYGVVTGEGGMLHSLRLYPLFRTLLRGTLASNSAFDR